MQTLDKKDIMNLLEERFRNDAFKKIQEIPHPSQLAGLHEAVDIIIDAIHHSQKIVIIGDYDVDGVIGTTLLCNFFQAINYPIHFIIPNRFTDGYGLSTNIIERIDADLIITVDNGITATQAATLCKEKKIKLIITDHHTCPEELPNADVIVNPKLPYCPFPQKDICGANVGWYLIAALRQKLKPDYSIIQSLDILSFAIVADVMPLVGINRILLKKGLEIFKHSNRPAIILLRDKIQQKSGKLDFNSEDIAFNIAPLLNSAGRMEDASISVAFLMSQTLEEAKIHYERLNTLNCMRKQEEKDLFKSALIQIQEKCTPTDCVVIAYDRNWHEGVIGIVAAKMSEYFRKPSFILTFNENGLLKGSGRSFGEINLISLLQQNSHLLYKFGGHKGAVGFEMDIKNIPAFKENLNQILAHYSLHTASVSTNKHCIGEVFLKNIDNELMNILETFEPYGEANPKPHFFCKKLIIKGIRNVGNNNEHTSLTLYEQDSKYFLKAIAFNQQYHFKIGECVDSLFCLTRNSYYEPQLVIESLQENRG
ncbi:single-stranded-DNA-specific exonuclease RecJ [Helicobacter monodelphidis]|uniref:single-stranded-DNA-specific exonuclease RecJ n=1 Tax=Helicobacter sp. 15-1451 TaxID=2004995 RepID=UPI000DCD7E0D|nr:single-stranded-DNA-specific exonuclease RecJ [Helicobacter sp. 15-1451]RAX57022.1 single-stranded-DNA-specific exonuclease RecJ [Helicobacter sp. 15-1451]